MQKNLFANNFIINTMVTQINNYMFINHLILAIITWSCLGIFALFLVGFRRDFNEVINDLLNFLFPGRIILTIISFILIFLILPFSIPYSIAHFIKK
jgi:hypothetical protein